MSLIEKEVIASGKFSKQFKLLKADDFKFVFSDAQRFGNRYVTVLARKNDLGHARLGLAISKKCARNASDRNRIKRLFRESFRLIQQELPPVDLVALCKTGAETLDRKSLRLQIDKQWLFIRKRFN